MYFKAKDWKLWDIVKPEDLNRIEMGIQNIDLIDTKVKITNESQHFVSETLDGALNELFTYADSGKKNIVAAIGSPAQRDDSFKKIADIIHSAKTDIRNAMNEKGCNIPENPTFPEILNGLNDVGHFVKSKQIQNLTASVGFSEPGKVKLVWENPIDNKFAGVVIVHKTEDYPKNVTDGIIAYDSNNALPATETIEVTGLTDGTTCYFRAFAYTVIGTEKIYTDTITGAQCTAVPIQLQGKQVFTSSTTWSVPYGVEKVDIFLVGGGGKGADAVFWDAESKPNAGGGGGGGHTLTLLNIPVTPGTVINIVVGAGGQTSNGTGGSTIVVIDSRTFTALGGNKGGDPDKNYPHRGGSGGSAGGDGARLANGTNPYLSAPGQNGHTNGASNPSAPSDAKWGRGQETIAYAFEEEEGAPYGSGAGGGSAAAKLSNAALPGGVGGNGSGNGGSTTNEYPYSAPPTAGAPGTGDGGGGAALGIIRTDGQLSMLNSTGAPGGSGVVIIRWGHKKEE